MNKPYDFDVPESYKEKIGFEYKTDSAHNYQIFQILKKMLPPHSQQNFYLTDIRDNFCQFYVLTKINQPIVLANVILDGENFTLVPVNSFEDFLDDVSYAEKNDISFESSEKDKIDSEKKQMLIDFIKYQVSNLLYKYKKLN